MTRPELSELVSARLCHDLISPMGAIGNGLELMQLSSGAGAAELALVNDSLATALAKLRFFRIAFGPADPQGRLSPDEAAQITDAMFHGRFTVAWETPTGELPRPLVRLIYLAVLCLERSLPMGGQVRVAIAGSQVQLAVEGRRTAPAPEFWAHLSDGAPLEQPKSDGVQFSLLRQALKALSYQIDARFSDSAAEIGLSPDRQTAEAPI